MDGSRVEDGLEVAACVEFGVELDGGRPDDARPGLVEGEKLERRVSGAELSWAVVVVRQHQVGVQGGLGGFWSVVQRAHVVAVVVDGQRVNGWLLSD